MTIVASCYCNYSHICSIPLFNANVSNFHCKGDIFLGTMKPICQLVFQQLFLHICFLTNDFFKNVLICESLRKIQILFTFVFNRKVSQNWSVAFYQAILFLLLLPLYYHYRIIQRSVILAVLSTSIAHVLFMSCYWEGLHFPTKLIKRYQTYNNPVFCWLHIRDRPHFCLYMWKKTASYLRICVLWTTVWLYVQLIFINTQKRTNVG